MPIAMGAVSLGTGVIGGILGNDANQEAAQQRAEAMAQAAAAINNISVPEARALVLQQLKSQGQLTPQLETALTQPPSRVGQIKEDQSLRDNQVQALNLLQQRAQGGLSFADRTNLNQIQQQNAASTQGKLAQLKQSMQERGQAGSGAELAQALSAAQSGQQNANQQGEQVGAQASQNAMNAISQLGSQASGLRSQDFGVANTKAQALDQYNRFNTQNQQQIGNTNVQNANAAQQYNLNNSQNISNQNAGINNQAAYNYQQQQQQQFQNQLNKTQAANQYLLGQANATAQGTQQQGQFLGNLMSGIGQTAATTYGQVNAQNNQDKYLSALMGGNNAYGGANLSNGVVTTGGGGYGNYA